MPNLRAILIAFLLFLPGVTAMAQGTSVSLGAFRTDPSLPVEVTADQLDVDQAEGSATFTGNVLIVQGEMRLAAQRVVAMYAQGGAGIERLEATGGVTLVNGPDAAEAATADYTIKTGMIEMRGDVLLTQGPSALSSDAMTVDLNTGTAQMTGRVKTILRTGD